MFRKENTWLPPLLIGYEKYKLPGQKGYSLKINPKEADMIKLIFHLYCDGKGLVYISEQLYRLGFNPRRGIYFAKSSITHILTNPIYIGKIKYTDKATTKKVVDGKIVRVRNENKKVIYVDGLHEPIITLDTWNIAQNIRKNNLIDKAKIDTSLKNSMATILKCGICGKSLERVTYSNRNDVRILCRRCKENVGSNIEIVEDKLIKSLQILLDKYKIELVNNDNSDVDKLLTLNQQSIDNYLIELEKSKNQLNKTYDLLEQEIYTKEVFIERSNTLKAQIKEINSNIENLREEKEKFLKRKNNKEILVPKIENVIDSYYQTDNIELKNKLLKSVLEKVTYTKINPKNKDDFKLTLYPKIY